MNSSLIVAQIPKTELASRLKAALYVPNNMPTEMKERIDLFEKGDQDDITTMHIRIDESRRVIHDLKAYIKAAQQSDSGKFANPLKKINRLEKHISEFSGQLSDVNTLAQWVNELNLTSQTVVDLLVSQHFPLHLSSGSGLGTYYNVITAFLNKTAFPIDFAKIPTGDFIMGTPDGEKNRESDEIQRLIHITHKFEMQINETTQAEWFLIMGYNPAHFKFKKYCPQTYIEINNTGICPDLPVETVSWNDVQAFSKQLNTLQSKYTYRLPTEAEWEYSARAGQQTAYYFGETIADIEKHAWYTSNSFGQSQPVALKQSNNFSLYDMHGNVWEWVYDVYDKYQPKEQVDPIITTSASRSPDSSISLHVMRGGCWGGIPRVLRSGNRSHIAPHMRWSFLGFRLQRTEH